MLAILKINIIKNKMKIILIFSIMCMIDMKLIIYHMYGIIKRNI